MRQYEAMFIFDAQLEEEKLDKEIKGVEKIIKTRGKGKVRYNNLGKKMLAYPIKKIKEGVYVNYLFTAEPLSITKIKDALKHKENIVRSIVFVKGGEK